MTNSEGTEEYKVKNLPLVGSWWELAFGSWSVLISFGQLISVDKLWSADQCRFTLVSWSVLVDHQQRAIQYTSSNCSLQLYTQEKTKPGRLFRVMGRKECWWGGKNWLDPPPPSPTSMGIQEVTVTYPYSPQRTFSLLLSSHAVSVSCSPELAEIS